jgi:hypothetical protein
MRRFGLFVCTLLVACFVGCKERASTSAESPPPGPAPTIVGKWQTRGDGEVITFEFAEDGTMSMRKGDKVAMFKIYRFDASQDPAHLDFISGDQETELTAFTQKYLAKFESPKTLKIGCARQGTWNFNYFGKPFEMKLTMQKRQKGEGFSAVGSSTRPASLDDGEVWTLTKTE